MLRKHPSGISHGSTVITGVLFHHGVRVSSDQRDAIQDQELGNLELPHSRFVDWADKISTNESVNDGSDGAVLQFQALNKVKNGVLAIAVREDVH